jgi:DNA-binding NarL/FixJ family response regulator
VIRILVADDHVVVRNGLKLLIGEMGDAVVAGVASNGDEVLEVLQNEKFDLLLLDLTMPGLSGVELIKRVQELHADLPILVLSMRNDLHGVKHVMNAGIAGYVTKGGDENMLISAIRKVAAGGGYLDPVIAEQLMLNRNAYGKSPSIDQLSKRELQIMKLLAQGVSATEIGNQLGINIKTVSTYKLRLMKKMDFKSNSELAIYAAQYGLVDEKKY